MNQLRQNIRSAGLTVREVAKRANIAEAHIHVLLTGQRRRCPASAAVRIEAATDGAVARWMLRPDLWPPPESTQKDGAAKEPGPA
jgi:DNA-binding transcriptional regulator YdaS (Cro superfamily)